VPLVAERRAVRLMARSWSCRRSWVEHRRLIGSPPCGVGLFWFGTLLGPEATAARLWSSVPGLLRVSIPRRVATAGGAGSEGMCRWVFEI